MNGYDHLNYLLLHRSVYEELISPRALELYQIYLGNSSNNHTKIHVYTLLKKIILFQNIMQKMDDYKNKQNNDETTEETVVEQREISPL